MRAYIAPRQEEPVPAQFGRTQGPAQAELLRGGVPLTPLGGGAALQFAIFSRSYHSRQLYFVLYMFSY